MAINQQILVTVDVVFFTETKDVLHILLVRRKYPPFQGSLALPGGFVENHEEVETAARRELQEETGVSNLYLEQFHTFGKIGRDPRGRNVSIVHLGLAAADSLTIEAGDDAAAALLLPVHDLPSTHLAFDHLEVARAALGDIRHRAANELLWQTLPLQPDFFTGAAADRLRQAILKTVTMEM